MQKQYMCYMFPINRFSISACPDEIFYKNYNLQSDFKKENILLRVKSILEEYSSNQEVLLSNQRSKTKFSYYTFNTEIIVKGYF